ncbi:helix-turn-helix transcriptional regulator [Rickettsiella endosymbiont of Dermanyssus gallinae]|uniref:helix-turn-helix transcriptional regulator n=1 Tax=Rickettsiella endosymbiont of Dermanyssus gallinae TaxID=2856608 RepID=UPI001C531C0B|nr:helix-turn-helix transcriptional regulator [Rickettsiella endosymbiont of Dermanyssus gallinae]
MATPNIDRFAILNKLSEEEKFWRGFAKTFLEYLDTLSTEKRIKEMESLLYETEVKQIITLDQRLTEQESKCLYLSYKGKNIQETASILKIAPKTVEGHRSNLRKKLRVKTMEQAVGIGIKYLSYMTKVKITPC